MSYLYFFFVVIQVDELIHINPQVETKKKDVEMLQHCSGILNQIHYRKIWVVYISYETHVQDRVNQSFSSFGIIFFRKRRTILFKIYYPTHKMCTRMQSKLLGQVIIFRNMLCYISLYLRHILIIRFNNSYMHFGTQLFFNLFPWFFSIIRDSLCTFRDYFSFIINVCSIFLSN